MTSSKKDLLIQKISAHPHLLRCPKCHENLALVHSELRCGRGHTFDLSKRGSVHFLLKPHRSMYGEALFEARRRVAGSGVFHPLMRIVAERMKHWDKSTKGKPVLDAGCGEGSLTHQLARSFSDPSRLFLGLDISKEGIQIAARESSAVLWMVADLSNLPLQTDSMGWVVNILSPANYGEFQRVLSPEGLVLKVLPGRKYLQEFREVFYQGQEGSTYDNERIQMHFQKHLELVDHTSIHYSIQPDALQLQDLIRMTPLLLEKDPDDVQRDALKKIQTICLDYEILIGRPKQLGC